MSGSLQLERYRSARRQGRTMMTACAESGIAVAEARLIEADDARNPPPIPPEPVAAPEPAASPEPQPAPVDGAEPENPTMARGKRKDAAPITGEVAKPDFDLAVRLYREDIRPAAGKVGEHAQEMSTAYKAIKKRAHIQPQAARLAFRLDEMEESKRDDFLRSFSGLLNALRIFMPVDLVDQAQGKGSAGDSVVPMGERRRPQLATVPAADGTPEAERFDAALADAAAE